MKLSDLLEDFVKKYNLQAKFTKYGYVYIESFQGMYGLLHSGILDQELLEKRLNTNGYRQSTLNTGFWRHAWRPILFTLCVDDFGVKFSGKEHVDHLIKTIHENYTVSTYWEGTRYLSMNLE